MSALMLGTNGVWSESLLSSTSVIVSRSPRCGRFVKAGQPVGGHHPDLQPLHPVEDHRRPGVDLSLPARDHSFIGWIAVVVLSIIIAVDLAKSSQEHRIRRRPVLLNFIFIPILASVNPLRRPAASNPGRCSSTRRRNGAAGQHH